MRFLFKFGNLNLVNFHLFVGVFKLHLDCLCRCIQWNQSVFFFLLLSLLLFIKQLSNFDDFQLESFVAFFQVSNIFGPRSPHIYFMSALSSFGLRRGVSRLSLLTYKDWVALLLDIYKILIRSDKSLLWG